MAEHRAIARSNEGRDAIWRLRRTELSSAFARSRDRPMLCHGSIARSPIAHARFLAVAPAEFFQKLGLFAVRGFLGAEDCRRVNAAMETPTWTEGTIGGAAEFAVDREYRRTR